MASGWNVTIDCVHPRELAAFWALALGYVDAPHPDGFTSWEDWLRANAVPAEEWDDGAYLVDPSGSGPKLSFLKVPEPKTVKNRRHIDINVGGGRQVPWDERWPLVQEKVDQLTRAGATIFREFELDGRPDHVWMKDPEGNELCVL